MKHDINNGIISAESLPEYWHPERVGAKANTLRSVTHDEYSIIMWYAPETIEVTNAVTNESFVREISSIIEIPPSIGVSTYSGEKLILISWWS